MFRKLASVSALVLSLLLVTSSVALAHVIVTPNQAGIGSTETFTISVPTEKDNPTVGLRLLLPDGLQEVTPTVKSGWTINVKKNGDTATEIDWTGGSIPPEENDTFTFRAQVPAQPTTLNWKAYQTYQDGSIVSWDQTPNGSTDSVNDKGPYSQTKVINDLASNTSSSQNSNAPLQLSIVAIVLALIGIGLNFRKR